MDELIEKLNRHFGEKYSFLKLFDVVYDKQNSVCTICFLYPETSEDIADEDKQIIANFVKEFFSLNGEIRVKFRKSYLDSSLIDKEIKGYFALYHKGLNSYIKPENISSSHSGIDVSIQISLNKDVLAMTDTTAIKQQLVAYLNRRFIANFDIEFGSNQEILPQEIEAEDLVPEIRAQAPRYEVRIIKPVFGGEIAPQPEYIRNITSPKAAVILAGKLSDIKKKTFIAKKGKQKGEEKAYYSFLLNDGSGKIECIYFSSKSNEAHLDKLFALEESLTLSYLMVGDIQKGLSDRLTYYIRKMSTCSVVDKKQEEKPQEEVVAHKHMVEIIPIETTFQDNLFTKDVEYNDLISDNDIVVFDLETTGLNPENCEITEIGAVKICHGVIKERFGTFVKIKGYIPDEVTAKTGITKEMTESGVPLENAILDFYDFCKDCVLSGYNVIGFDIKFIQKAIAPYGLHFSNPVVDAFLLARHSSLRVKNYTLSNVVSALGLTLEGAHRAYNDAEATAKVLLALSIKK